MTSDKNIFSRSAHLSSGQMLNYLKKNLSREELHEVERHLADCDLCNDALDGLRKLEAESSILTITAELQKLAGKRKIRKRKIFSQLDLITLFALIFLIIFMVVIAVILFR